MRMYSFVTPKERPTADRATISQNSITPSDVTTYSNDIGHCSIQSNFSRQIKKTKTLFNSASERKLVYEQRSRPQHRSHSNAT